MAEVISEKPIEQKTEITNPVLKEKDLEASKRFFNDALADAKSASPAERMLHQDVSEMKPKRGRPRKESEPAKSEEIPPVTDQKVEERPSLSKPSTDAHKTELPEDIFTPADKKEDLKPSEAVAELDAMELPEESKPESKASFAKLKESSKSHIARLESELAELRSRNGQNGDYEALKKQASEWQTKYGELEERFGRELYTQSPQFQQAFTEKEQAAISGAKAYLDDPESEGAIVDMLAGLTPKRRKEVLSERGIDQYAAGGILAELSRFDGIQRDKSRAIENWKNDVARSVEQQTVLQQQQQEQRRASEEKVWDSVVKSLDLLPFRQSKDEKWNARGQELLTAAKRAFNGDGVTLEEVAESVAKGKAYDALNDVVTQLVNQNKDLRSENSKLKANKPGGEMTQGTPTQTKAEEHSKISREESAKKIFNEFYSIAKGGG